MFKLFILLFLCSCSTMKWTKLQNHFAQKELSRITGEFEALAKKKNINLKKVTYHFVEMKAVFPKSDSWAGACAKGENVYLDMRWWNNSHVLDKEQVVFHELGHCALGLKHGAGLMSQKQINYSLYLKEKQKLLNDLFESYKLTSANL